MKIENDNALEHALIHTVETELTVMQSFCRPQFPCDVATTVAMRMSRAVVSAICRLSTPDSESTVRPLLSEETTVVLLQAQENLADLSNQFEQRLATLPADAPEWKTWTA